MSQLPKPPKAFSKFVQRFPKLGKAWELLGEEGNEGPLDEKTARLIKLGIAIGAMKEGSVHAAVRKALAKGVTKEEMEQIVALTAGTLGLPTSVAVYSWINEELEKRK